MFEKIRKYFYDWKIINTKWRILKMANKELNNKEYEKCKKFIELIDKFEEIYPCRLNNRR